MIMEGEIKNFIMVWTLAVAIMCYSYTVGKLIRKSTERLMALFPAIVMLFLLPIRLTLAHLVGPSSFLLGWLSTFKLILFAFNKGPLSSTPHLPLLHFVFLACFPVMFQDKKNRKTAATNKKIHVKYIIMVILSASFLVLYKFKESFHPTFTLLLHILHIYIGLEIILALFSAATRILLDVQLDTQFDQPYLSTSLQEFWGRRWNIMVNRIMHPITYDPIVKASSRVIGRKWAPLPGIIATFAVSGLMHEMVFYCVKREKGTWEKWEPCWDSICFFLLHGITLALEVALKKTIGSNWHLPKAISWLLTMAFVVSTGLWLFIPALVRSRVFVKVEAETLMFTEFVKNMLSMILVGLSILK